MFFVTFFLEVKMEIKYLIFIDWLGSWNFLYNFVIVIKLKKKIDKLLILIVLDWVIFNYLILIWK